MMVSVQHVFVPQLGQANEKAARLYQESILRLALKLSHHIRNI